MMIPSPAIIEFIKSFEGLLLEAKPDEVGVPTIGYGTIEYPNGCKVRVGEKCSIQEANDWLVWEAGLKGLAVNKLTKGLNITQPMFDALVSFAYNLGVSALEKSTLLRKLKVNPNDPSIYEYDMNEKGKPVAGTCEFLKWVYAGDKIFNGLIRRRAAEAAFYKSGV